MQRQFSLFGFNQSNVLSERIQRYSLKEYKFKYSLKEYNFFTDAQWILSCENVLMMELLFLFNRKSDMDADEFLAEGLDSDNDSSSEEIQEEEGEESSAEEEETDSG